jgi:hypothetical protein
MYRGVVRHGVAKPNHRLKLSEIVNVASSVGSVTGLCSVTRQSSRCGKIRGFATPPRSGCAVSADDVCSGAILASCRRLATTGLTIIQDSRKQSLRPFGNTPLFPRRDVFLSLPEVALLNSDSLKGKPIERWGRKASGLQAFSGPMPAGLPARDCAVTVPRVSVVNDR